MGTGIVSVALASDHAHTLSLVLLVIAGMVWLGLAALVVWRQWHEPARVRREARSPAALTGVAASAVLGARLVGVGWSGVAAALLVTGSLLWLALLAPVLRHWRVPAAGAGFMVAVSTQSLAVLSAQLAVDQRTRWLLYAALALLVLGLALYVFALAGFDYRQLMVGAGDQWVAGGALAISALAAARITIGARHLHALGTAPGALRTLTLALWVLAAGWLPPLLITEVVRPRLCYDVRRWATVFPVGMYAACSFDTGLAAHVSWLVHFAKAWVWVGFATWLVVFSAMAWRARLVTSEV